MHYLYKHALQFIAMFAAYKALTQGYPSPFAQSLSEA